MIISALALSGQKLSNFSLVFWSKLRLQKDILKLTDLKGFGVVTGINQEKKLLYLKTALNDQELSSINCLTSGSMLVPNGYFLKKAKPGHPYVQAKPNLETPLNIPWQRSAKPRLQEFQQQQNNK